jgi:HSP20 family molecular chaperone IbpA
MTSISAPNGVNAVPEILGVTRPREVLRRTTLLWRSSIGFDRDRPPYDIARTGDDTYRITLVLGRFSPDEISITVIDAELGDACLRSSQHQLAPARREGRGRSFDRHSGQGL